MTLQPHVSKTGQSPDAFGFYVIRERMPLLLVIDVSGALSVSGTSSADSARLWGAPYVLESEATTSGLRWEQRTDPPNEVETTRKAISELRRLSGLTWEQLGELFEVSRRSIHFWASGKPLNAGNERRLMRVLNVVRAAERGDARSTRAALFEVKEGTTAFELLTLERFEEALAILGIGTACLRPALAELSAAAQAARRPLSPEHLVDAQQDRVHRELHRARPARTVRNNRRGTP